MTETIKANKQTVAVTVNLANALRHVKSQWLSIFPGRDVSTFRIWADAVCIYQDRYRSKCCKNLRFEPQVCEQRSQHADIRSALAPEKC